MDVPLLMPVGTAHKRKMAPRSTGTNESTPERRGIASMAAAPEDHKTNSIFFKLHPELRNQVYEYIIQHETPICIQPHANCPQKPSWVHLLHVNKQIRKEAGSIAYSMNTFLFTQMSQLPLFLTVPAQARFSIKQIDLMGLSLGDWTEKYNPQIFSDIRLLQNLQTIVVSHSDICLWRRLPDSTSMWDHDAWFEALCRKYRFFRGVYKARQEQHSDSGVLNLFQVNYFAGCRAGFAPCIRHWWEKHKTWSPVQDHVNVLSSQLNDYCHSGMGIYSGDDWRVLSTRLPGVWYEGRPKARGQRRVFYH